MRGSRTEYIHWIQDVPDQKAIVAQYCRYTGEIKTGKNIKQIVNRALQFATSDPAGPVYLCGAREVMEEDLTPYKLEQKFWGKVEPAALSGGAVEEISRALVEAKEPLILVGYTGRNHASVGALVELADLVKGVRVLDTGGSDMCFPADHRAWLGLRYGIEGAIKTADAIVVIDCGMYFLFSKLSYQDTEFGIDVPWINTQCHPDKEAKIFHIDVDPLKK
jgi:thiamine pyrophosphate-dependent acetolactate synthase large subunit-like protein